MSVTRLGIFSTLDKFLKPLATINLPKSPTILGNFCKGVKIYHFSIEIIFVQLSWTFANFSVTLPAMYLNISLNVDTNYCTLQTSERVTQSKDKKLSIFG